MSISATGQCRNDGRSPHMNDAMSQTMVNTTELTKPTIAPNASQPSTPPPSRTTPQQDQSRTTPTTKP